MLPIKTTFLPCRSRNTDGRTFYFLYRLILQQPSNVEYQAGGGGGEAGSLRLPTFERCHSFVGPNFDTLK